MNLEEALEKISNHISRSENSKSNFGIIDLDDKIHEIYLDENICKVRELTWYEGLQIDMHSYKKYNGQLFFSSENEKREILKLALVSVNDKKVNISELTNEFVENIWNLYQKYLHLSNEEINFIYNACKKYFSKDEKEFFPIHPLIIEVDYMLKGIVNFSKTEFENLSIRKFEAIQLIISTKNEII